MENITMRITAAPKSALALALTCATPATDLRTTDVRSNVRSGKAPVADQAICAVFWGDRVRVTAPTTGMGHVGTGHIVFGADYVPGSRTWSPPI
jgi:hypothetical protein